MQKRKPASLKQRNSGAWSPRRKLQLQNARRKILRRNNTYFLTTAATELAA